MRTTFARSKRGRGVAGTVWGAASDGKVAGSSFGGSRDRSREIFDREGELLDAGAMWTYAREMQFGYDIAGHLRRLDGTVTKVEWVWTGPLGNLRAVPAVGGKRSGLVTFSRGHAVAGFDIADSGNAAKKTVIEAMREDPTLTVATLRKDWRMTNRGPAGDESVAFRRNGNSIVWENLEARTGRERLSTAIARGEDAKRDIALMPAVGGRIEL